MLKVAVVGYGGYGWQLVRAIDGVSDSADIRLVAAAEVRPDAVPEKTNRLHEWGTSVYTDALEMYDALQGRCDAVYIATGIGSHTLLTCEALRRGYHVHLEKPPAATVQEVDEMIAAAEKAQRLCLVGFQAAHKDDVALVKQRVAEGKFGEVTSLACYAAWPRNASYYGRNNWAGRLRSGDAWVLDGPATNALAHQITNMLLMATGEPNTLATPTAVRAELYAAAPLESHDTAAIEIATAEGPKAYFLASHACEENHNPVIEITGTKATAVWHYNDGVKITYADGTSESCPGDRNGHPKMIVNLADAIRAGAGPEALRCSLQQSRHFTVALNGAHESSQEIHHIDESFAPRFEADTPKAHSKITGINAAMETAARLPGLFSDLSPAPAWAQATEAFDVTDYHTFPAQFADPAVEGKTP